MNSYVNLVGCQYLSALTKSLFIWQFQGLERCPTESGQQLSPTEVIGHVFSALGRYLPDGPFFRHRANLFL